MSITVWNTLTRKKEEFHSLEAGKVSIYSCGLTPQGPAHLGHLRGAVVFDAIRRWLAYRGYAVRMIQNFTDVDDKIIRKSHEEGIPAAEVAKRYADAYLKEWNSLGILPVEFVKVTENIDAIVSLTKSLVDRGYAYATDDGDVFFSVSKFPGYGKLSNRDPADMEAGARIEIDPAKREPMDFALWKSAKPGEPAWESPWGLGRPGWHIECSALSINSLGESFDIHAGGIDLLFPHHENEVAQSEAATGVEPFAHTWMHWGSVNSNGEKMSKSLGNYSTIAELLPQFGSDVLRMYVLGTHYRSPIDYTNERVASVARAFERITGALSVAGQLAAGKAAEADPALMERFGEAMDDDFNTAQAIGVIFDIVGDLHKANAEGTDIDKMATLAATVRAMLALLGIAPALEAAASSGDDLSPKLIDLAIAWRKEARAAKQYALSDRIREDLRELGIILEDRPQGTTWSREG